MGQIKNIKLHIVTDIKMLKMIFAHLMLGFMLLVTIEAISDDETLPTAVPNGLGVLTANWQNCRYVCQRVLNCYAFTWISSSKICFLKHKTGWSTVSRRGMYSSYQEDVFPIM